MNMLIKVWRLPLLLLFAFVFINSKLFAQNDIPLDLKRARGIEMLETVRSELKNRYYDPGYRGIDIEKSFKAAKEAIKKAERTGQINAIIAQFLLDLDDSHAFFLPADRVGFVDYGVTLQMIDKLCYVAAVKKDSDAEKKGVKPGDLVYSIETFEPTRESLWKINYFYNMLSPQEVLRLVFQNPDGSLKETEVRATMITWEDYRKEREERKKKPRKSAHECKTLENELTVCRLSTFSTPEKDIDKMISSLGQSKALILDLRSNGGGYVKTLKHLVGYFFEKDVLVGTEKMRKKSQEEIAKTHGNKVFGGKLTVLIDSKSASAAEVFARVIQLEKRGTVIGDRSAGAVMTSVRFSKPLVNRTAYPIHSYIPYGASITIADLIMADGKSLEKVGVTPDFTVLPKGVDLAQKNDPILSYAVSLSGGKLDPKKAGELFSSADLAEDEEEEN